MSGSFDSASSNFRALDQWVALLNAQVAGSTKIGYKAERNTFLGGVTGAHPFRAGLSAKWGEATFRTEEYLDFSQGMVTTSASNDHLAIKGQGFFAVAKDLNAGTEVLYTRNGEFHVDEAGYYRDALGYYMLTADDVDPEANVVRDPVQFGRTPYPSALEPFGPGALGVSSSTFNDQILYTWQAPTGGLNPANIDVDFDANTLTRGTLPSATQWVANLPLPPKTGAYQETGWYMDEGSNGGLLRFGNKNSLASYEIGPPSARRYDILIDWEGGGDVLVPNYILDLHTHEDVGGPLDDWVSWNNGLVGTGTLNRATSQGQYTGGTCYNNWDLWYYVAPPANVEGIWRWYVTNYSSTTNPMPFEYVVLEDVGTSQELVFDSGSIAVPTGANAVIPNNNGYGMVQIGADFTLSNTQVNGEVFSPEFAIDAGFATTVVDLTHRMGLEDAAADFDQVEYEYRLDGGAWITVPGFSKAGENTNVMHTLSANIPTGGASTIQFRFGFDSINGKNNADYGWGIDSLAITQTGAVSPWATVQVNDLNNSLPPTAEICLYSNGVESALDPITEGVPQNVNYLPAASWPLGPDAEWRIYDTATGLLLTSFAVGGLKAQSSTVVDVALRRGVRPLDWLDDRTALQTNSLGVTYFEAKLFDDVPDVNAWYDPTTNPFGAKLIRSGLEGANTSVERVAPELLLAKQMYEGLTKVLQARISNLDLLMNLIR